MASAVADVDAITLSLAKLSAGTGEGSLAREVAARGIVLAAATNTVVKGGVALGVGSTSLRRDILPGLLLTFGTAVGVVFLV